MDLSKAVSEFPLIERDRELLRLLQCASTRIPALLTGSPGLGRTRLLRELGARLRVESIDSLYVPFIQPLHTFLVSIATRLSLRAVKDSSVALRGLLCNALEIALASFFWMTSQRRVRSSFFRKSAAHSGHHSDRNSSSSTRYRRSATHILGPSEKRSLRPSTRQGALMLTQQAVERFAPDLSGDEGFQERVAHVARGNPDRIVEMCRRAASATYRDGKRVRFAALSIDSLTGFFS